MRAPFTHAAAALLAVSSLVVGCNSKKAPLPVVASCDFRGAPKATTATCIDVLDKGFAPQLQPICMEADPSGKNWHPGVGCDRAGAFGACKSEGLSLTWHFPSDTEKSADDAKKACSGREKFVKPEDEPSVSPSGGVAVSSTAAPSNAPDLAGLLGTKGEGWLPKPFAGLTKNMTLAQVTKVLPWAKKLDPYGVVETPVTDVHGVVKYRLRFVDRKLSNGEIWFDPTLHTPAFRSSLLSAGTTKWGEPKVNTDSSVMWFSPTSTSVALSNSDGGGYELECEIGQ